MAQSKSAAKTKTTPPKTAVKKGASAKARSNVEPLAPPPPIRREVAAVVFLFLGIFCIISYFNTDGAFVAFFSNLVKGLLGWGFWLVAPAFLLAAYILGFHRGRPVALRVVSALLLPILFGAIANLWSYKVTDGDINLLSTAGALFEDGQKLCSGGVLGGFLAVGLEKAFSIYGAFPLLLLAMVFFAMKALDASLSGIAGKLSERVEYDPSRYAEPEKDTAPFIPLDPVAPAPAVKTRQQSAKTERVPRRSYTVDIPLGIDEEDDQYLFPMDESRSKLPIEPLAPEEREDTPPAPVKPKKKTETAPVNILPAMERDEAEDTSFAPVSTPAKPIVKPAPVITVSNEISDPPKPKKKLRREELDAEAQAVAAAVDKAEDGTDYDFPPVELLRSGASVTADSRDEVAVNRERLEGAIRSFGINASIVGVTRGPTVTRYDIELEQGVKLARVTNLAGDLALALGVVNVRIAPIPDKISTVGIEVPNKIVSTVYLRDIVESPRFTNAKSKLSFAIGKDIGGECIVGNISKLPHMLIAGTTGSGKSVCMNSLILSLLYKARPDELRFIMIDPKMVELGVYNGIPHLYVPVVTDPKKSAGALQWSVVEMLKRYRLFSEAGVRDLDSFNKHNAANGEAPLPRVVIVIDELADLMMVASKEVEESICRVAQMGRAAGMHLVIATQRPSADVITGLMKANIPSRIAFAVSSAMESRIILDQGGAEKLVGMGDMLYSPVGCGKPTRVQGAFVSDEEREEVIQFIKESCAASENNNEIEEYMDKAAAGKDDDKKAAKDDSPAGDYDEMLPQAVEAVLEMKSCSVSMLQRRVKLGYSRAARIVDQMEELGIVGPYEGAKPRSVIVDRDGWHSIQVQLGLASDEDLALAAEMNGDGGEAEE